MCMPHIGAQVPRALMLHWSFPVLLSSGLTKDSHRECCIPLMVSFSQEALACVRCWSATCNLVHWVKEIQHSYRLHPMCTSPHLDVLFWKVVSTIWHISNAILVYSCDIFVSKWLWFFIIDTPSWVHTLPTDPAERTHRDQGQLLHCPTRLAGKGSYLVDQRCWQPRMVEAFHAHLWLSKTKSHLAKTKNWGICNIHQYYFCTASEIIILHCTCHGTRVFSEVPAKIAGPLTHTNTWQMN